MSIIIFSSGDASAEILCLSRESTPLTRKQGVSYHAREKHLRMHGHAAFTMTSIYHSSHMYSSTVSHWLERVSFRWRLTRRTRTRTYRIGESTAQRLLDLVNEDSCYQWARLRSDTQCLFCFPLRQSTSIYEPEEPADRRGRLRGRPIIMAKVFTVFSFLNVKQRAMSLIACSTHHPC